MKQYLKYLSITMLIVFAAMMFPALMYSVWGQVGTAIYFVAVVGGGIGLYNYLEWKNRCPYRD